MEASRVPRGRSRRVFALLALLPAAALLLYLRTDLRRGSAGAPVGVAGARDSVGPSEPVAPAPFEAAETADLDRRTIEVAPSNSNSDSADLPAAGGEATPRVASGRVYAFDGTPVPGLRIGHRGPKQDLAVTSGADGSFALRFPEGCTSLSIESLDPAFATVRSGVAVLDELDREHVVIVAPSIELSGRVVSSEGEGMPEASLEIAMDADAMRACPVPFDLTTKSLYAQSTDEHGKFRFPSVPAAPGARLVARKKGYVRSAVTLDGEPSADLEIVLQVQTEPGPDFAGVVLRRDGSPAYGAIVSLDGTKTAADASGRFEMRHGRTLGDDALLVAVEPGVLPALVPDFGAWAKTASEEQRLDLSLVLGASPLAIEGRVVDADGTGLPGWTVQLVDGTELVRQGSTQRFVETLASSEGKVVSGRDGAFRIGGLLERDYRLLAYEAKRLVSIVSEPVAAGRRDVVLALGRESVREVSGIVVSRSGARVAGVQIRPSLLLDRAHGWSSWISGDAVVTRDDGTFVLASVPLERAMLSLSGDAILPQTFDLDATAEPPVRLEVSLRCRFRVVSEGQIPQGAKIQVLDAGGLEMSIHRLEVGSWSSSSRWGLDSNGSGVLAVDESARTLQVVVQDGRAYVVKAETALRLDPSRVDEVRIVLP
jgi:hypothetical protein